MTIGDRIKTVRESKRITQEELGKICGTTKQTIFKYESGIITNIPLDRIEKISSALGVQPSYLMGWESDEIEAAYSLQNVVPMPRTYKVPLIGTIACGQPILAVENADESVEAPEHVHADFALRCKGNSMIEARIHDGDIVYIRSQPQVENGQIAAVRIGDEATLKKVRLYPDMLILEPANHEMEPLIYRGEELNSVEILGKAVAFTSAIR